MKRGSNREVAAAFVDSFRSVKSKAMRVEGGVLYSFKDVVGIQLGDGGYLLRHQSDLQSQTTSAHVNLVAGLLVKGGKRFTYADFNAWKNWGINPREAVGVTGVHNRWAVVEVYSKTLGGPAWITTARSAAHAGLFVGPSAHLFYQKTEGTWITLEPPRSLAHVVYSIAPPAARALVDQGIHVGRLGRLFMTWVRGRDVPPPNDDRYYLTVDSVGNYCGEPDLHAAARWCEMPTFRIEDRLRPTIHEGRIPLQNQINYSPSRLREQVLELIKWD